MQKTFTEKSCNTWSPNIIYVHIVIISNNKLPTFFLDYPFAHPRCAKTHLGAAHTHFESRYARFGLGTDTTWPLQAQDFHNMVQSVSDRL
jgi:hypothetical protein